MPTSEQTDAIQRYSVDVWGQGDLDAVDDIWPEAAEVHLGDPPPLRDTRARRELGAYRFAYPTSCRRRRSSCPSRPLKGELSDPRCLTPV
jgi:hypothetical protein